MSNPYLLMAPGPVQLAPEVLEALAEPMIHHRTPEFDQILKRVLERLPAVFKTSEPVMMISSTGSGAMEAALINTLSTGDEVLAIVSGKFGERWSQMAQRFGLKVHELQVPWGEAVDLSILEKKMRAHPRLKAVLTQACETSTATLHPVQKISELVQRLTPEALLMVDAITAIGATPLPMDEWQLDVVVAGSQKAFMLPTGLSFVALSKKAWKANASANLPRFYFDLLFEKNSNQKGETYFSSNVVLIKALDRVLHRFENLEVSIHRCQAYAEFTRQVASELLRMDTYSRSPAPSVTALKVPSVVDGKKLRLQLESKYNVTVMGGQDQLQGKILRIGHLGYVQKKDLVDTLTYLGMSFNDLGYAVEKSALARIAPAAETFLKDVTL